MTPKSDRRILTFQAVVPCSGVSPIALLNSLIALARTIAGFRSKTFGSHQRNIREAARQIAILLIFLEEIRDCGSPLSDSTILCFSELHIALQKIQYLLQDCGREGARLWILMQSDRVTNELRILIRTAATALEILPLASIDVDEDVRELVELVTKQAQKVKVEIDPADERAVRHVVDVLGQFEKGISPDQSNLKWVLDNLEIRSWSECNQEIRFLEEEMELENSKGTERGISLLSSLVGLMSYCRATIFDALDCRSNEQPDCRCEDREMISCLNLEDFRCPISLELMIDPVIIASGHTYDRSSIVKWFKAGNLICPKTGEKLLHTKLIPNSIIHKLIQKFCNDKGISIVKPSNHTRDLGWTVLPGSPAAAEAIRMLAVFLVERLAAGTEEEKNRAAYEVRLLSKSNIYNRECLVEAGAVCPLLDLLSSIWPLAQENAIAALLNLSKYSKGKTIIFENGGVGPILDVLTTGLKMEARQNAAAALFYLSSVNEYREAIGQIPVAIPALVDLIRSGPTARGKKNAVVALFGLLLFPGNHRRALAAGAVQALIDLLTSERSDLVNDCLAVLATLAEKPEGATAIHRAAAIPLLVSILRSSSSQLGKEYIVSVLLSLCITCGAEAVSILQKTPSIVQTLYSLLTDGTSRAMKKANSLLRLLHNLHDLSSMGMSTPAIPQDQAVHVQ
ncbi:U-box domain-containing protein 19-like [Magnolia sinica]|uniref:U-box domain-containing protein 19-like n=1 Tax=Magnolia sinica TaxID=86752 RepID=UPI00265A4D4D|nr:U-box domain-containing protein 19-like [Magnolia sinica]